MNENIVIVCEARDVAGDTAINVLGVSVVFEVFVVGVNGDGSWGTHQEVSPMVKAPHEGEKFAVVDVVVAFGIRESLRVEPDCSMFTPVVHLC